MTGNERAHHAWVGLRRINSLVNTGLIIVAMLGAGVWWWHSAELTNVSLITRLDNTVARLERTAGELERAQARADEALRLGQRNERELQTLSGRLERNEARSRQYEAQILNRLERIERLLLERAER